MSVKSLVCMIDGLPRDPDDNSRVYLFTSWTRAGIEAAALKVETAFPLSAPIRAQRHLGVTGTRGDEWWSFTAILPCEWVASNWHATPPSADRYGMRRFAWTLDGAEPNGERDA